MVRLSIFDLIGPVMIGPSSSHTAGAVRLGNLAQSIFGKKIASCQFYLHGSFAQTYKGHGTHLALVAGVMGWRPDDSRIKESLEIALRQDLLFTFIPTNLGPVHPNTVKMVMTDEAGTSMTVVGSSLGGGLVEVTDIDGFAVGITGNGHVLLVVHQDRPGVVARVTRALADDETNISFMTVVRSDKGSAALMVIETDQPVGERALREMQELLHVINVSAIRPLGG